MNNLPWPRHSKRSCWSLWGPSQNSCATKITQHYPIWRPPHARGAVSKLPQLFLTLTSEARGVKWPQLALQPSKQVDFFFTGSVCFYDWTLGRDVTRPRRSVLCAISRRDSEARALDQWLFGLRCQMRATTNTLIYWRVPHPGVFPLHKELPHVLRKSSSTRRLCNLHDLMMQIVLNHRKKYKFGFISNTTIYEVLNLNQIVLHLR